MLLDLPGLCPVDLQLSFLKLCHARPRQMRALPCRPSCKASELLAGTWSDSHQGYCWVLDGETANNITDSADCAIGFEAAHTWSWQGFRAAEHYVYHIEHGKCFIPSHSRCPAWRFVRPVGHTGIYCPGGRRKICGCSFLIRVTILSLRHALICEHPCEARCRRNMIDSPSTGPGSDGCDNAPGQYRACTAEGSVYRKRMVIAVSEAPEACSWHTIWN